MLMDADRQWITARWRLSLMFSILPVPDNIRPLFLLQSLQHKFLVPDICQGLSPDFPRRRILFLMQCVFAFYILISCTELADVLFATLPWQMVSKVA